MPVTTRSQTKLILENANAEANTNAEASANAEAEVNANDDAEDNANASTGTTSVEVKDKRTLKLKKLMELYSWFKITIKDMFNQSEEYVETKNHILSIDPKLKDKDNRELFIASHFNYVRKLIDTYKIIHKYIGRFSTTIDENAKFANTLYKRINDEHNKISDIRLNPTTVADKILQKETIIQYEIEHEYLIMTVDVQMEILEHFPQAYY